MPLGIGPFKIRVGPNFKENTYKHSLKYGHKKWDHPLPHPQPFRVTLKGLGLCPKGYALWALAPLYPPPFLIRGGVVWGPYGDNPFISHLRPLTPALYKGRVTLHYKGVRANA